MEYLGLVYSLPLDDGLRRLPRRTASPQDASDAWLALARADLAPLREATTRLARERRLGDWGLFRLLEELAAVAYPADASRRSLLHWYLTVRHGQDTRIALARGGYAVLYAADTVVYQAEFLARDGRAYYLHDPDGRFAGQRNLRTPDAAAPGERSPMVFDLAELPATAPDPVVRTLDWQTDGRDVTIDVTLDRRLVAFLASIPQTGLRSHFGAGLSSAAWTSLTAGLSPHLAGLEPADQVAVLLSWVQHAIPYETDQEQFGHEDYLYPDETLFYPAADCEDRAALLAVLVRGLVGLPVVGLDYPGHIATAVAMGDRFGGDHFVLDGTVFTVCDPTFIGAAPGRSMPRMEGESPGLILPAP
jgi:hypothetical protein